MSDERAKPVLPINPLTAYDVMGYVVPGGALVLCLFAYEQWARANMIVMEGVLHTPVSTLLTTLLPFHDTASWSVQTLAIIALLMVCYSVGHVVASVSAIAIERFYVAKGHGYPFRALLGLPDGRVNPMTKPFHRALFFWINAYLLVRYVTHASALGVPWLEEAVWESVAAAIGWLVAGMILLKVSFSARYGQGNGWWQGALKTPRGVRAGAIVETTFHLLARPEAAIANLFATYLNTRNPLSPGEQAWYKKQFERVFIEEAADKVGSTNFWWSLSHVRHVAPELAVPADNWLRLYSFARNLSAAFFLSFLYCGFFWWDMQTAWLIPKAESASVLLYVPLALWLAALAMLLRYYYLYADYLTKYVFRTFVYLTTPAAQRAQTGR